MLSFLFHARINRTVQRILFRGNSSDGTQEPGDFNNQFIKLYSVACTKTRIGVGGYKTSYYAQVTHLQH